MNTLETLREDWKGLAQRLDGTFKFYENMVNVAFNSAKIVYKFNGSDMVIRQEYFQGNGDRISYKYIEIESILFKTDFVLNIWRLDYFDKLFSRKRKKTGFSDFDCNFGFECSNEIIAVEIFKESAVRDGVIYNQTILLNTIEKEYGKVICMKDNINPFDVTAIEKFANFFNGIVEKLQKMDVIKA